MNRHIYLLLLVLLISVSGCLRYTELSPEEQILAFLDRAEVRVEDRDLTATVELISRDYADLKGHDRQALSRLLARYFLQNKSIHVLKKVDHINLNKNERSAQVMIYAGLAGSAADESLSISQWKGNLIRLEADLLLEDDYQWRLIHLNWRQVSQADFLH